MARRRTFAQRDPSFEQTGPFHHVTGSARPKSVNDLRVSEVNTQRFAAGSRGPTAGGASGQGPALDSK